MSRALVVDGAGEELLAGTRLACSSTVARVGATVPMISMTRRNGALSPTKARAERILRISRRKVSFSRRRRTTSSAWCTAISSVSARIGLVR
ncbi:MAG: hypothetical protein ACR2HK_07125 [Gemmatimonadales bacterium]